MKKLDFPLRKIHGVTKYHAKEIKSREALMENGSVF